MSDGHKKAHEAQKERGRMNALLRERRGEIKLALHGLGGALFNLGKVRDAVMAKSKTAEQGDPSRLAALNLTRACAHLARAAEAVPEEVWDVVLDGQSIGATEMEDRFFTMRAQALAREQMLAGTNADEFGEAGTVEAP